MRGQIFHNIKLAEYTSWRVGGPAEILYIPADLQDLADFLPTVTAEKNITWLGLGSNTLISDDGLKGVAIVTQARLNQMQIQEDGITVRAEAGVACPAFARFCARQSLEGTEFMAGIPGTVGGALAMNAGCHGGETWDTVVAVETIDRHGKIHTRTPKEFQVAYRSVTSKNQAANEWFVAGIFRLQKGEKEESLERIRELLAYRTATQPTSEPSCGSVFRNPAKDYAARLIEACDLKGYKIGGAMVSTKHANFIVNIGTATAKDIVQLINHIHEEVLKKQGIDLIREVHILGNS